MDYNTFDTVVSDQVTRSLDMLHSKNGAYNPNEDKLHIFKRMASLRNTTPQGALSGMMAKHTGSIYDMCESGQDYPIEVWDEKITDHINYLLLLRAVVAESCPVEDQSEEDLAELRRRLTDPPQQVKFVHEDGTPVPHENHVDKEIYVPSRN